MRITSSSGKSIPSLAEICAGRSRPAPIGAPAGGRGGASSISCGDRREACRQAVRSAQPGDPRRSGEGHRSSRASPPSAAAPRARRATARSSPGTPEFHCAWPRCAAARARPSSRPDRSAGRSPARRGPGRASHAISSRSTNDRCRPEGSGADGARCDGGMPPASRNQRDPTACDTPPSRAASSLDRPAAIASQNRRRSSRFATPGRPGNHSGARSLRSERRPLVVIATSIVEALQRPVETAQPPCLRPARPAASARPGPRRPAASSAPPGDRWAASSPCRRRGGCPSR